MKASSLSCRLLYPIGLALLALLVFIYIFDTKVDVNGDNCYYYIFATSLAAGDGYADMLGNATAHFPPGYPLLMAPLRFFTDSVVAQKVLNLVFFFAAVLLFFYTMVAEGVKRSLAFIACAAMLVTPHLLEFSRMMMSEASCIFFISLALFAFKRLPAERGVLWRSPWLYVFVLSVVYTFYIRTQAIVFVAAVAGALLFARRFKEALLLVGGFAVALLPWVLRNAMLGLEQSRYVNQIDLSRVWKIAHMLVVQAIPESVVPFFKVHYGGAPTLLLYIIALSMLALVLYGFWRLKSLRLVLFFSLVGNVAIISVMNSPSLYRYMIIVLPFITMGLVVGLWSCANAVCTWILKKSLSPWFLLLLFVPTFFSCNDKSKGTVWGLNKMARASYSSHIDAFISIGAEAAKYGNDFVTASRKPELLYVKTGLRGVRIRKSTDGVQILNELVADKVDFLILENLGIRYTYTVLYPFIKDHPQFFEMLKLTPQPANILFKFNRETARQYLVERGCYYGEK